jgi:hypothetical protein
MNGQIFTSRNTILVFLFGILVLFLPIIFIEFKVLRYTHGVFMYPFDDTFIHLQIAKNLTHGHWGISTEFASASSSLLYTIVLAIFRFVSSSTLIPFIVNCLAGIAIVWFLHLWLQKHIVSSLAQGAIMLLAFFVTPLALMVVTGMEHTLQCLLSFIFIFYFSDWLESSRNKPGSAIPVSIYVAAALAASIRYEGLFLIGIACIMLLYYKKIKQAFLLGLIGVLPVVIYGIFSLTKGSYFLPNSVLVKSETFSYSGIPGMITHILFEKLTYARNGLAALSTQRWLIILPLLYLGFKKYIRPSYSFIIIFLLVTAILQLSLASTGYLYRYEAYLFFCSTIIMAVLFYQYGKQAFEDWKLGTLRIILLILVFFLFFPIVLRSTSALEKSVQACKNIYEQQYQMAQFSKSHYFNSTIAANDIGALSYFTNASIVDLWGLSTIEVTKSKKGRYWTPAFLDSLSRSRGVNMAIIYDSWFPDSLTSKWKKAGTWQIQNNVICGDDIVSFYALDSTGYSTLYNNLKSFEHRLPPTVIVKYF